MAWIENLRRPFLAVASAGTWSIVALQCYLTVSFAVAAGGTWLDGIDWSLSYFTNLTNLLVAIIFTSLLVDSRGTGFFSRPRTVAAVMLYILVVGVLCLPVLCTSPDLLGLGFVTRLWLHGMTPIGLALYWILFVAKGQLRAADPIIWLSYPAAYFAYVLGRGAISGAYPYTFFDVHALGYGVVLVKAGIILAIFVALGIGLTVVDRLHGSKPNRLVFIRHAGRFDVRREPAVRQG